MQDELKIENTTSTALIEKQGARFSLILNGLNILVPLTNTRFDGRIGSTHPCSPNFGPYGKEYGLSQHGPARSAQWSLVAEKKLKHGGSITLSLELKSPGYPKGVIVTQVFLLQGDAFTLSTTHKNTGTTPAPVIFGEHLYWVSPQGWENVTINGKNVAKEIKADTLIQVPRESTVLIPGHAAIRLTQGGMPYAKLWSMPHGDGTYDTHYFCFEPMEMDEKRFGQPETMIQPGESRTCSFSMTVLDKIVL